MLPRASRFPCVLLFGVTFVLCVSEAWPQDGKPPANPLKDQFREKGLDIPGVGPYKLPDTLVHEGMTPDEVQKGLAKAAGQRPLNLFLKGDRYSPTNIIVEPVPGKGERQAYHIRLHMVAKGNIENVLQQNLLNQLIGGAKGKAQPLNAAQLKQRNLTPLKKKGFEEQYEALGMQLLQKVEISGITRTIKTFDNQSVYTATILDERFAKDKQHPNAWQHLNANGMLIGKPHAYSGMGGYVQAIQLPGRMANDPAVYLEMHYILHEPKGWFNGTEVLRSKLRPLVEDNAREFRRKLIQGKRQPAAQ